jgi:hypothetical protein
LLIGDDIAHALGVQIRAVARGQRFANGRIEADHDFRHATLLIEPDTEDIDARYPLLSEIQGRGFLLFGPYVIPATAKMVRVSSGGGRFRTLDAGEATGGFLLVGTAAQPGTRFKSIVSSNSPAPLANLLLERTDALLDFYQRRLRMPPSGHPTIVLAYSDAPARGKAWPLRGDVTSNGIVFLRVSSGSDVAGRAAASRYTTLLSHELFHLWNRRVADVPDSETWLHEGSADYFSWLAISALWPTEVSVEQQLEDATRGCAMFYGTRPLREMSAADARNRYLCGAVAQWVVDVGIRHRSAGGLDAFDLWSELLARPGPAADYTLNQYRMAVGRLAPASSVLLTDMIDRGTNWAALMAALTKAGADVVTAPATPSTVRFVAARSLALSACGGFGGAGEAKEGIFVTVPDSCTMLNGATLIERINGVDPMAEPTHFYAVTAENCSRQGTVELQLNRNGVRVRRELQCTTPVEAAPPQFRIRRAFSTK